MTPKLKPPFGDNCLVYPDGYFLPPESRHGELELTAGGIATMEENDPHGINQHEAGAKLDAGKPDASLLLMFGKALLAVAEVGTFGARKYSRGGWQKVDGGITRYTAALLRHLCKEQDEDYDTDSDLLHASQVAWNALARLELILREREDAKTDEG